MHAIPISLSALRPVLLVIYIAAMGMACVLSVMIYLGVRPDPAAGVVFMSLVYGIYMINRFTDMSEDFANDADRAVTFSNARILFYAGAGAMALGLLYLVLAGKLTQFHLLIVAVGLVYSYSLIPWYRRSEGLVFLRLKELPLVKNLVVALLWGTSVFAVPILFSAGSVRDPLAVSMLVLTLTMAVLNNTVFSDIKDVAGDRLAGSRTMPVLAGVRPTYLFLVLVNGLWFVFFTGLFLAGRLDGPHFLFILAVSLFPAVYMVPYEARLLDRSKVEFLSDSILIVFSTGLFVLAQALGR